MRAGIAMNPHTPTNEFDKLCAELAAIKRRREWAAGLYAQARGAGTVETEFRKSLSELETMFTALPPPRPTVILKGAPEPTPAISETISKAFSALNYGNLTPAQRGELMIRLGGLADLVKAHPMISRIDDVIARLDAARAGHHAERAEGWIEDAEEMLATGKLTQADHARLRLHLSLIRSELKDHDDAKKA